MKSLAKSIILVTVTLAGCIALSSSASAAPEGVFTLLSQKPQLIEAQAPVYPQELRQSGKEGEVQVIAQINKEGRLTNIQVAESTDARFNEAALATLSDWRYTPAMRNGQPIDAYVTFPVVFTLGADPKPSVTAKPIELMVAQK